MGGANPNPNPNPKPFTLRMTPPRKVEVGGRIIEIFATSKPDGTPLEGSGVAVPRDSNEFVAWKVGDNNTRPTPIFGYYSNGIIKSEAHDDNGDLKDGYFYEYVFSRAKNETNSSINNTRVVTGFYTNDGDEMLFGTDVRRIPTTSDRDALNFELRQDKVLINSYNNADWQFNPDQPDGLMDVIKDKIANMDIDIEYDLEDFAAKTALGLPPALSAFKYEQKGGTYNNRAEHLENQDKAGRGSNKKNRNRPRDANKNRGLARTAGRTARYFKFLGHTVTLLFTVRDVKNYADQGKTDRACWSAISTLVIVLAVAPAIAFFAPATITGAIVTFVAIGIVSWASDKIGDAICDDDSNEQQQMQLSPYTEIPTYNYYQNVQVSNEPRIQLPNREIPNYYNNEASKTQTGVQDYNQKLDSILDSEDFNTQRKPTTTIQIENQQQLGITNVNIRKNIE